MGTVTLPSDVHSSAISRCAMAGVALGANPLHIAQVWFSESGWHADAHNPHGDAVGLCQIMPAILRGLGYLGGWETFARMPAEDQIQPWIIRYYRPYANLMTTPELAYLATFLPAYFNPGFRERNGVEWPLSSNTVIAAKMGRLGWAFVANAVFDANHDGRITLGELGQAIARNCIGPRYDAIAQAVAEVASLPAPAVATVPSTPDLRTVLGVQRALSRLGYPLVLDGARGPKTIAHLRLFQSRHHLVPDGLVGPVTRAALESALNAEAL